MDRVQTPFSTADLESHNQNKSQKQYGANVYQGAVLAQKPIIKRAEKKHTREANHKRRQLPDPKRRLDSGSKSCRVNHHDPDRCQNQSGRKKYPVKTAKIPLPNHCANSNSALSGLISALS